MESSRSAGMPSNCDPEEDNCSTEASGFVRCDWATGAIVRGVEVEKRLKGGGLMQQVVV